MNEVIHRTLSILEPQSIFHNITIETRLDETLAHIWIDENQIEQVLMNIALNAAEAMKNRGPLLPLQAD